MKISNLIFLSIFFILVLFSITTYVNYKQSEKVRENAEFLAVSSEVVRQSNQFQRNVLYMERGVRGFLITGEDYLLLTYDSAYAENSVLLKELTASIPAASPQAQKLLEIKSLYDQWVNKFAQPIRETRSDASNKPPVLLFRNVLREEERINKTLRQEFRELLNMEYANRAKRRDILENSEQQTKVVSILLTGVSIVIGFIIAGWLARHISTRILKMVKMANAISRGDYQVQVKDRGKDELSKLTRSLNYMATMLEENISLLKRKNKELDQFAHIVSHDLKAPLRGIDNVITWIEEDHGSEVPERVDHYLKLIKGRIRRSENLIEGILSYARIGKEDKENTRIDLTAMINDILLTLPLKAGLSVIVNERMPIVYSERIPLIQVFTNLISNAIKYHDKEKGEIRIYSKEESNYYKFFVEDDGPGIAPSYHDKIFVIFQTLSDRDTFESTGVGLAIVKKILDERGEQIELTSEPGKGSIFSFTWSKQTNK